VGVLFTTPRLAVRPWDLAEAPRLFDIRSRESVAQWLSDPAPWADLAVATEHIERWATRIATCPPFGSWAIVPRDTDVPVGTVSLNRLPNDDVEVEIGWYLHPDAVGHGWAREAAAGMLVHAFAHGIDRVWAIMWPHNDASAAVARAIGMMDLGVIPDPWYGEPDTPDSLMFRIDRPDA
jgi:RimJ/RimL family protein N-acetyltransferase